MYHYQGNFKFAIQIELINDFILLCDHGDVMIINDKIRH